MEEMPTCNAVYISIRNIEISTVIDQKLKINITCVHIIKYQ